MYIINLGENLKLISANQASILDDVTVSLVKRQIEVY